MNHSHSGSSKTCDRLPLTSIIEAPIIEGGVAPKTLKLSAQWQEKDGKLICYNPLGPALVTQETH